LEEHAPIRTLLVPLRNDGGGSLSVNVRSVSDARVHAAVTDDAVSVTMDTGSTGPVDGLVELSSNGGTAVLRVTGQVTAGPKLSVAPGGIDFGSGDERGPNEGSASRQERAGSFWTSMPGIFTGLAALVTAIAAVFGVMRATESGDGGGQSSTPATVSAGVLGEVTDSSDERASWAAAADAICTDTNDQVAALGQPQNTQELGAFLDAAIPIVDDALVRFRELTPPKNDAASVERAIGLEERARDSFAAAASSLSSGDTTTANQLFGAGLDSDTRASEVFRSLGAQQCDSP
jgi:hypothetical protein